MATIKGTTGNDSWTLIQSGQFILDGLAGVDTLDLGQEWRSSFRITQRTDGGVQIDSLSTASGGGLEATLYNIEFVRFDHARDIIDLRNFFEPTEIAGTAGNDTFQVGRSGLTIDGKAGIDSAVLPAVQAAYALARVGSDWQLTDSNGGTTRLQSVERLQFTDGQLALDLDGHAGTVARVLAAVFGPSAVVNETFVGIGLQLADADTSPLALVQLALDARLGAGAAAAAVVDLLYTNVVGQAPSAAERQPFIDLLDSGAHSAASLGLLAAEHPLNLQFALVGLMQTGLGFE